MEGLGGGFSKVSTNGFVPRLVVALDGLERGGKTHQALTLPGPIAYQSIDAGDEGVIEKFVTKKTLWKAEYKFSFSPKDSQEQSQKKAVPVWESFAQDWREVVIPAMKTGSLKSAIWDTGSDLWKLVRVARLGKLTQVMPHHYVQVNSEMQALVREVYDTPGNLCILHKLKAQWADNPMTGKGNKTGQYERDGYSEMGFLVQVNATAWRELVPGDKPGAPTGPFHLTVRDCRQNPAVAGLDLAGEMASMPWLATNVFNNPSLLTEWGG